MTLFVIFCNRGLSVLRINLNRFSFAQTVIFLVIMVFFLNKLLFPSNGCFDEPNSEIRQTKTATKSKTTLNVLSSLITATLPEQTL